MKHNQFSKLSVLCLCYLIMSPHYIMANIDGLELDEMSKDLFKFSEHISNVTTHFQNIYKYFNKVNADLLDQLKSAYEQQARFRFHKVIYASLATATLILAGALTLGGYADASGLTLVAGGAGSTILTAKCTRENDQVVNSIKDNVVNITANLKSDFAKNANHINNLLTKLNKHGKNTDAEKHAALILIMALHQNMSQFNSAPNFKPITLDLPELAESITSFLVANPQYMSHFEFLQKIPVTPQLVGAVALLATVVEAGYAVGQTSDAITVIEEVQDVLKQYEYSLSEIIKFLNEVNINALKSGVKDTRKTDL